jgi:hypothetical protein
VAVGMVMARAHQSGEGLHSVLGIPHLSLICNGNIRSIQRTNSGGIGARMVPVVPPEITAESTQISSNLCWGTILLQRGCLSL